MFYSGLYCLLRSLDLDFDIGRYQSTGNVTNLEWGIHKDVTGMMTSPPFPKSGTYPVIVL